MMLGNRKWRWMLLLCIGMAIIIILQKPFMMTFLKVMTENANIHCANDCQTTPTSLKFYSQCGEDRGVYTNYFSSPFVQCNGTYLEIGALDGIRYSNTKYFEDTLGWTGVLIEAEPSNFKALLKNRPKSKLYGKAICSKGQKSAKFSGDGATGGLVARLSEHHKKHYNRNAKTIEVSCIPMKTLLNKAGVTHIDFFSLDVEGGELSVLQTMDWSIPVRVFVIELGHNKTTDDGVRSLLAKNGYAKPPWDIRSFCSPGGDCALNEVFENINQKQFTCK